MIVVNWNRCELLRACLQSLKRQTGTRLEVIVVDNGSHDGSAEMAAREFGGFTRLIRNAENRGFCAANNQGIQAARGTFIALLNNDAEAEPGWLSALRGAFDAGPEIGMAASKILMYEDPGRIDKAGHLIYPDGQNRGRGPASRTMAATVDPKKCCGRMAARRCIARKCWTRSAASMKIFSHTATMPSWACERASPDGVVSMFRTRWCCIIAARRWAWLRRDAWN